MVGRLCWRGREKLEIGALLELDGWDRLKDLTFWVLDLGYPNVDFAIACNESAFLQYCFPGTTCTWKVKTK